MTSRSCLALRWPILLFAVMASSPSALAVDAGSTPQKQSGPASQPERKHLVRRVDAMKNTLDALEQAVRAGSVDAQQQRITELRRQLAEMRSELSSAGEHPPPGRPGDPSG